MPHKLNQLNVTHMSISVVGQKPRRAEAPRFLQLGQKPRDTFTYVFS